MKEEQGKKLDPNDPAIPAKLDKSTALPDEDLDKVAGGIVGGVAAGGIIVGVEDASKRIHDYKGTVTLVR